MQTFFLQAPHCEQTLGMSFKVRLQDCAEKCLNLLTKVLFVAVFNFLPDCEPLY